MGAACQCAAQEAYWHCGCAAAARTQVLAAAVRAPEHALPVAFIELRQAGQARQVDRRHLCRCRAPCTV